jgi:hypothetical protein
MKGNSLNCFHIRVNHEGLNRYRRACPAEVHLSLPVNNMSIENIPSGENFFSSTLTTHLLRKTSLGEIILGKMPIISEMIINGEEFLTVRDMADRLNKNTDAVKKLLHNAGLKPISRDALYPIEAYNAIKDAPPPGRPRTVEIFTYQDLYPNAVLDFKYDVSYGPKVKCKEEVLSGHFPDEFFAIKIISPYPDAKINAGDTVIFHRTKIPENRATILVICEVPPELIKCSTIVLLEKNYEENWIFYWQDRDGQEFLNEKEFEVQGKFHYNLGNF